MKKIILILFLITTSTSFAQDVKFKKKAVYIDKLKVFSLKSNILMNEYYFNDLNTDNEIIYISYDNNGTEYEGDDYTKIFFTPFNLKIESKSLWFGLNSKPIIKKLLQEKVIDKYGKIDEKKLETFYYKYNEQIIK